MRRLLLVLVLMELIGSSTQAFYDASVGRWVNRDPINEAGGINMHAFVDNDPVKQFDPFGLLPPSNQTCQALRRKIENLEKEIQDRTRELYEDPLGLPGSVPGDDAKPSLSKRGHQKILNMMKANLAAKKALYQALCNDPEPPKNCPIPFLITGPVPFEDPKTCAIVGGVGACLLAPEILPLIVQLGGPVLAR